MIILCKQNNRRPAWPTGFHDQYPVLSTCWFIFIAEDFIELTRRVASWWNPMINSRLIQSMTVFQKLRALVYNSRAVPWRVWWCNVRILFSSVSSDASRVENSTSTIFGRDTEDRGHAVDRYVLMQRRTNCNSSARCMYVRVVIFLSQLWRALPSFIAWPLTCTGCTCHWLAAE